MRMVKKLSFAAALGLAAFVSACSDPVPPPPQSIASIALNSPIDPSKDGNCGAPHTVNVPQVPSFSGLIVNETRWQGDMLTNQNGGTVTCSVKPAGNGFSVNATATLDEASAPEKKWGTVSVSIDEISDQQTDVEGTLTVSDYMIAGNYSGSCKFSAAGGKLQVAKGRIWASVVCEAVGLSKTQNDTCAVGKSFFIFQNCTQ